MSDQFERFRVPEIARAPAQKSTAQERPVAPGLDRYFAAILGQIDHLEYGDPSDYVLRRTGREVTKSPLSEVWVPAIFRNDARPNSEETLSGLLNDPDPCRLVLAGPGGGKSTLGRFITCLTIREFQSGQRERFGVFVPLSRYKGDASYRKSVAMAAAEFVGLGDDSEVVSTLEKSLETSYVIFDGLDELPISQVAGATSQLTTTRDRAVAHIRALRADPQRPANSPTTVQMIVTCRETEYVSDPCLGNVATYRLADFSMRQMNEAVQRWHTQAKRLAETLAPAIGPEVPNEIERRAVSILASLHDNSDLGSLCHRPLMLSILQTVYASGEDLPASVSHLCERAVKWLLIEKPTAVNTDAFVARNVDWCWSTISALGMQIHERAALGQHKAVSEDELRQLCRQAYPLQGASAALQVRERLTTEMFIHLMGGHGILVVGADGTIDFSHNVFREVMAGRALGRKRVPELRKYALNEAWHGPIRYWAGLKAVDESGWHEISALVGEIAQDAENGNVCAILAQAEMLVEVCSQASPDKWTFDLRRRVGDVRQALLSTLRRRDIAFGQRMRVGDLLGALGDPRIESDELQRVAWFSGGQIEMGRDTSHVTDIEKYQKTPASPRISGTLRKYALGKYLVTNREYAKFISAGGYDNADYWPNDVARGWLKKDPALLPDLVKKAREAAQIHLASELIGQRLSYDDIPDWVDRMINRRFPLYWDNSSLNRPNQPVVGVNWWEAFAYCRWLTVVSRASGRLSSDCEVRLPIEPEWEAAARLCGGGNVYPWIEGDPIENAHVRDSVRPLSNVRAARSLAVGSFEFVSCHLSDPVFDLVGNVWEWSGSVAKPYSQDSFAQRVDGNDLSDRIGRGSSWLSSERESTQITFRSFDPPYNAYEDCGFRIAVTTIGAP